MKLQKLSEEGLQRNDEFTLLDNSIIGLVVEKTKLKKEKYNLILTKTIIFYLLLILVSLFSYEYQIINKSLLSVSLIFGTLLLFIVYLFVIEHYNNIDRDIETLIDLLQAKSATRKRHH